MKLLLHCCCGPCSVYPVDTLRESGISVTGFFFNPNIHPFKEFRRRLNTAEEYSKQASLPIIFDNNYGLIKFLRAVVNKESSRCLYCYRERLKTTVLKAKECGCDSFSTTLLYSKYQNHSKIKEICEELSKTHSLSFYYDDFRIGWQKGIDKSIDLNMYRQPYCGCIYSEQERYDKTFSSSSVDAISSKVAGQIKKETI